MNQSNTEPSMLYLDHTHVENIIVQCLEEQIYHFMSSDLIVKVYTCILVTIVIAFL